MPDTLDAEDKALLGRLKQLSKPPPAPASSVTKLDAEDRAALTRLKQLSKPAATPAQSRNLPDRLCLPLPCDRTWQAQHRSTYSIPLPR